MGKKYRIGVVGVAHSHIDALHQTFDELEGRAEWVGFSDVVPETAPVNREPGTRLGIMDVFRKQYGDGLIFANYTDVLDQKPDIVLCCADNAFHPRIIEEILLRGIHVVVEKPMAASMQGALRIARAAKAGNAVCVVNWPSTWSPGIRAMKKLCSEGKIGKVFKFTYRNSDSEGPLSYGQQITDVEKGLEWWHQTSPGGGSLLDYCCYGACLSSWFLGEPATAAYALKANFNSPYGDADDYATITARFPSAVAILEGSWTTVNSGIPNGPNVFGTEGTMCLVPGPGHTQEIHIFKTRHKLEPDEIIIPNPLPEGLETLGKAVLAHLDSGVPLHDTLAMPNNLRAMSILDAGIRSAQTGKLELVNDGIWTIGNMDHPM